MSKIFLNYFFTNSMHSLHKYAVLTNVSNFVRCYGKQTYLKNQHHLCNLPMVAASRKRFYKNTGILRGEGKFEVTLDQRKLKTPKGNPFIVESEPLALAVATEWNSQKGNITRSKMHLVGVV
jgi:ATP synthase F1 complex assembly factor 2